MFTINLKVTNLLQNIIYHTQKSKRTTTPKPFNNPQITPQGILTKQPRSYDYDLYENLPNKQLYWNRTVENKLSRKRYNQSKLNRLSINPIHDQDGNKLPTRDPNVIAAELTSLIVLRQSINRTLVNLYEATSMFPDRFLGEGPDSDVVVFAMNDIHDRHLVTLNFYNFSTYCQLRNKVKLPPTEAILLHFFRHLEGFKVNNSSKLSLKRLGQLSSYIFTREYPGCENILKKKEFKMKLFEEGEEKFITFEDIVPELFSNDILKEQKTILLSKDGEQILKSLQKIPGGTKLIEKLHSA